MLPGKIKMWSGERKNQSNAKAKRRRPGEGRKRSLWERGGASEGRRYILGVETIQLPVKHVQCGQTWDC